MKKFLILFFVLTGAISGSAQNLENATFQNVQKKDGGYHFRKGSLVTYDLETPLTHESSFSVSAWVRYDVIPSADSHLINISGSPCGSFQQKLHANSKELQLTIGASCGPFVYITTKAPRLHTWYHYVIVTQNKNTSLYVNANKVGETAISASALNAEFILFGGHHSHSEFFGQLNNIAFYNKGLTEQEIINIYNNTDSSAKTEARLYTKRQIVPPGFSMINIPFSYRDNSVGALFGVTSNIVVYDYDYHGGWLINYYDTDFEEWDTPNHVISAGTPVWILNNTKSNIKMNFQGKIPTSWRPSFGGVE